jgi:hypothetical protein
MLRSIAGIIAGLLAWAVIATLGDLVVRAVLPGYTEVEATMNFTLAMLIGRLLLGAVSSLGAGFVTAWIARTRNAARMLAAILLVIFLPIHYSLWETFPLWYHVVFLFSLAALPLLGAMCYARGLRSSASGLTSH